MALIGASGDDDGAGAVYVFVRDEDGIWTVSEKWVGDTTGPIRFGRSVALDGNTALIGAPHYVHRGIDSGAAYVFALGADNRWTKPVKLLTSDGVEGDEFGVSVSLDGMNALVGAHNVDDKGLNSGAAYLFAIGDNNVWTQKAKLLAAGGEADDQLGTTVAVNGDTGLVGAPHDDDQGDQSGAAYVFAVDNWVSGASNEPRGNGDAVGTSGLNDLPSPDVWVALGWNHPNPFSPATTIQYTLSMSDHVVLEIFDALGRRVRVLVDRDEVAGTRNVVWDGEDEWGDAVSSGVYLVRLRAGSVRTSRTIVVTR
jgi:hypothetical protein